MDFISEDILINLIAALTGKAAVLISNNQNPINKEEEKIEKNAGLNREVMKESMDSLLQLIHYIVTTDQPDREKITAYEIALMEQTCRFIEQADAGQARSIVYSNRIGILDAYAELLHKVMVARENGPLGDLPASLGMGYQFTTVQRGMLEAVKNNVLSVKQFVQQKALQQAMSDQEGWSAALQPLSDLTLNCFLGHPLAWQADSAFCKTDTLSILSTQQAELIKQCIRNPNKIETIAQNTRQLIANPDSILQSMTDPAHSVIQALALKAKMRHEILAISSGIISTIHAIATSNTPQAASTVTAYIQSGIKALADLQDTYHCCGGQVSDMAELWMHYRTPSPLEDAVSVLHIGMPTHLKQPIIMPSVLLAPTATPQTNTVLAVNTLQNSMAYLAYLQQSQPSLGEFYRLMLIVRLAEFALEGKLDDTVTQSIKQMYLPKLGIQSDLQLSEILISCQQASSPLERFLALLALVPHQLKVSALSNEVQPLLKQIEERPIVKDWDINRGKNRLILENEMAADIPIIQYDSALSLNLGQAYTSVNTSKKGMLSPASDLPKKPPAKPPSLSAWFCRLFCCGGDSAKADPVSQTPKPK